MGDLSELSDDLVRALSTLERVADAATPDEAPDRLDDATLQLFWRDWPRLSSWAGALWRRLNDDLAEAAAAPEDPELDEIGGEGG